MPGRSGSTGPDEKMETNASPRRDVEEDRNGVVESLHEDHEAVRGLLTELTETDERERRVELVLEIQRVAEVHAQIEEQLVYPALGNEPLAREYTRDHDEIRGLLLELVNLDPEDEQVDAQIAVLRENLESHISEEEITAFPLVRRTLSHAERSDLAFEMEALREQLEETMQADDDEREESARRRLS